MTYAELIGRVAKKGGITKKLARSLVEFCLYSVETTVLLHGRMALPRFGTFVLRTRKQRRILIPQTAEPIQLPPSVAVLFRPAKQFKQKAQQ